MKDIRFQEAGGYSRSILSKNLPLDIEKLSGCDAERYRQVSASLEAPETEAHLSEPGVELFAIALPMASDNVPINVPI